MASKGILSGVDFDRDLPTTSEDVDQLWRVRDFNRLTPDQYRAFLEVVTRDAPPSRETNTDSDEPFSLE
jgi:hypothetical protein